MLCERAKSDRFGSHLFIGKSRNGCTCEAGRFLARFRTIELIKRNAVVPPLISSLPTRHKILVVDDEPDIFTLTKLSLKGLQYKGRRVDLLHAATGQDAVRTMRTNPDIALILLDVVMETNSAGLDACRHIREELGNSLVRILLRTGQPGEAPERGRPSSSTTLMAICGCCGKGSPL